MQLNENNYDNIEKLLFKEISNFKEYYYLSWYNDSDLNEKFTVISVLIDFIKENYIDIEYTLKWNAKLFDLILKLLNSIYEKWDKNLKELVCIWFIEWLIPNNEKYFNNFIKLLKYKNLQSCWKELIDFWY